MNAANRKELEKAMDFINKALEIIESVKDNEQDKFDNMPENLQYSEKGEALEQFASDLGDAQDTLESLVGDLQDIVERR